MSTDIAVEAVPTWDERVQELLGDETLGRKLVRSEPPDIEAPGLVRVDYHLSDCVCPVEGWVILRVEGHVTKTLEPRMQVTFEEVPF